MSRPLDVAAQWVQTGIVPGVAACVVTADGVVDELYAGVTRRGGDEPVGDGTPFALASLTKPLVAAAVMVAVEEGLLDLDEPVRDGFALRHLLSHASGLAEPAEALDDPPLEPPGTRRRYSNAGYALTGRLLQRAAEMAPADYLREAVLAPLGMDASLGLPEADWDRAAVIHEPGLLARGEPLFNSPRFRRSAFPAGGGFATAPAYAAFLRCLLRGGAAPGGALLSEETVDEMLATQFGELPGGVASVAQWKACPWGLGFDVRGTREPHWAGTRISPTASTHFGASGALAWVDRERGLGLVALANRGSYSGWGMSARGWAALSDAVVDGDRAG